MIFLTADTNLRFLTRLLLCVGLMSGCEQAEHETGADEVIEQMISEVQKEFAPDHRVAVFNVSWHPDTEALVGETNISAAKNLLLARLSDQSVSVSDSIEVLLPGIALVNVSVCNIRSKPKHSSELATQSLMGTTLYTYKRSGNWSYVQTPDGYLGWLDSGAFTELSDAAHREWKEAEKLVVVKSFDFISDLVSGDMISDVVEGNILRATGRRGSFYEVNLPDGRVGVISTAAVIPYDDFMQVQEPLVPNLISKAREFMGRPYMWGGTSGKAMDCSGFTKTVFYMNGLELPRDASQQVNVGIEVETDTSLRSLETGDLLFFGRTASSEYSEKITHVAMYLGDGKIIHASDRVQIESLRRGDSDFAEHRLRTFVRAKRMTSAIGENGVRKLSNHPWYE